MHVELVKQADELEPFEVYSVGLFYMSVCSSLPPDEIVMMANLTQPSGTVDGWKIADEPFVTGEANPCTCHDHPVTHKHWLLTC